MSCWSIALRSGQASHGSVVGRVPAAAAAGGLLLLPPELQQRVAVVTGQERQRRQRRTREGRHQGQEDDAQGLPRRHHLHLRNRYDPLLLYLLTPLLLLFAPSFQQLCRMDSTPTFSHPLNLGVRFRRVPAILPNVLDFIYFLGFLSHVLVIRCKKIRLFNHRPLNFQLILSVLFSPYFLLHS